jgi:hypothetical protein
VNPLPDKELMDGELGLSLSDRNREEYVRVALRLEDLDYDMKNPLGGVSERTPLGLRWLLRTGRGSIWITSEGRWGRGFSRRYEDPSKSPALRAFEQQENHGRLRLFYQPMSRWLLEVSGYDYRFSESRSFQEAEGTAYRYRNRISSLGLRYALNPGAGHGLRLGIQRVWQDAEGTGSRDFAYNRREWLPSAIYTLTCGDHVLVLGYMGSLYSWDFNDRRGIDSYRADAMTEKVKVGYTYHFSERGSLHLSVSHVFSFFGFGGGNVQFNLGL